MSYDGRAVANFVLDHCDQEGRSISNLALQKILYFCHVWSLIDLKRPLVTHQFEAWKFGPVLQYVYRDFKEFDSKPINARAKMLNRLDGTRVVVKYNFDPDTEHLLRRVVNFYSQLKSYDLVELSHVKNGPWHRIWRHDGRVNPGMKISDQDIIAYYGKVDRSYQLQ